MYRLSSCFFLDALSSREPLLRAVHVSKPNSTLPHLRPRKSYVWVVLGRQCDEPLQRTHRRGSRRAVKSCSLDYGRAVNDRLCSHGAATVGAAVETVVFSLRSEEADYERFVLSRGLLAAGHRVYVFEVRSQLKKQRALSVTLF